SFDGFVGRRWVYEGRARLAALVARKGDVERAEKLLAENHKWNPSWGPVRAQEETVAAARREKVLSAAKGSDPDEPSGLSRLRDPAQAPPPRDPLRRRPLTGITPGRAGSRGGRPGSRGRGSRRLARIPLDVRRGGCPERRGSSGLRAASLRDGRRRRRF